MLQFIRKVFFVLVSLLCFTNTQCEDDVAVSQDCDFKTIVSNSLYDSASSQGVTFINAKIEDDCLSLKIGASGCDGSTWGFSLVDSGAVAESFPEQRYLKLDFNNEELCLAFFERTITFDLKPVRVQGSSKVILHIEGIEQPLEYSY